METDDPREYRQTAERQGRAHVVRHYPKESSYGYFRNERARQSGAKLSYCSLELWGPVLGLEKATVIGVCGNCLRGYFADDEAD